MTVSEKAARKAELRAEARRVGVAADREEASRLVSRALDALPELVNARTVALYAAIDDEVPTDAAGAAIRARGGRTVYPLLREDRLELAVVGEPLDLCTRRGRVAEPGADALRVGIDEIDAFMIPGLLFDRSGRRLGRGGGHYDRLLERARADAALIGICYADRVIDELPQDSWDVAMNVLVTERFMLRFGAVRAR